MVNINNSCLMVEYSVWAKHNISGLVNHMLVNIKLSTCEWKKRTLHLD